MSYCFASNIGITIWSSFHFSLIERQWFFVLFDINIEHKLFPTCHKYDYWCQSDWIPPRFCSWSLPRMLPMTFFFLILSWISYWALLHFHWVRLAIDSAIRIWFRWEFTSSFNLFLLFEKFVVVPTVNFSIVYGFKLIFF